MLRAKFFNLQTIASRIIANSAYILATIFDIEVAKPKTSFFKISNNSFNNNLFFNS